LVSLADTSIIINRQYDTILRLGTQVAFAVPVKSSAERLHGPGLLAVGIPRLGMLANRCFGNGRSHRADSNLSMKIARRYRMRYRSAVERKNGYFLRGKGLVSSPLLAPFFDTWPQAPARAFVRFAVLA
jgi:hypothetical protein